MLVVFVVLLPSVLSSCALQHNEHRKKKLKQSAQCPFGKGHWAQGPCRAPAGLFAVLSLFLQERTGQKGKGDNLCIPSTFFLETGGGNTLEQPLEDTTCRTGVALHDKSRKDLSLCPGERPRQFLLSAGIAKLRLLFIKNRNGKMSYFF